MATLFREHLSSSSLTTYPFAADSGAPPEVYRLFCDASVSVPFGSGFSASIRGVSVSGGVLSFTLRSCGEDFAMFVDSGAEGGHYAVVMAGRSSVVADLDRVRDGGDVSDPGEYGLSVSCADFGPGAVSSFSLMASPDGASPPVVVRSGISGAVSLVAGTNMSVVAADGGVTLSAEPGAGAGTVPCECDSEADGSATEHMAPQIQPALTGDVVIEGDGCIQVGTDGASVVSIGGRCTACCPVDSYVSMANLLSGINERVGSAYSSLMATVGDYNEEASLYNLLIAEPAEGELSISVTATAPAPRTGAGSWSNNNVRGTHTRAYASTKVTNASQTEVSVQVSPPYINGMFLDAMYASMFEPISEEGDPGTRQVVSTNQALERSLPPGASLHIYSVFIDRSVGKKMSPGDHSVTHSAVFRWTGVVREGGSYVRRAKSVSKTSTASFTIPGGGQ